MFCPKCGAESQAAAGFCWKCGAKLPTGQDRPTATAPAGGEVGSGAPAAPALRVPRRLKADQYDHPLDRAALHQLRKLAPVVALVKLMIQNWDEPMVRANLLGQSIRVGPKQFPDIHELVRECAEILDIPEPEVFIKQDPYFNAMTFGVQRPFIILHSSLVDAFTHEELRSIIGHEMGHIKSEHVLYLNAVYFLTQQAARLAQTLFGIGALVALPARAALINWQRQAEFTADRAGVICVQNADTAVRAMAKLVLGSRQLAERLNIDDFLRQGDQRDSHYSRIAEGLQDHPLVGNRVREMVAFFDSEQYRSVFAGARWLGDTAAVEDAAAAGTTAGTPPREADRVELAAAAVRRGLVVLQEQGLTPRGVMSQLAGDARELEQAISDFELAAVLDPEGEQGIAGAFYSGVALIYLGQIKQARAVLEELRHKHPDHELGRQAHDILRRLA
ncbi:MAG: M48 family metalloprotease [Chloroflexota bacterium]